MHLPWEKTQLQKFSNSSVASISHISSVAIKMEIPSINILKNRIEIGIYFILIYFIDWICDFSNSSMMPLRIQYVEFKLLREEAILKNWSILNRSILVGTWGLLFDSAIPRTSK